MSASEHDRGLTYSQGSGWAALRKGHLTRKLEEQQPTSANEQRREKEWSGGGRRRKHH